MKHDTSSTAAVRQSGYIGDTRWLMPDAGNLAALLLKLLKDNNSSYQRIIRTIRIIAPFFDDFELEADGSKYVMLNWREKGSDMIFGPHQFSDGTLRAICLISLLYVSNYNRTPHRTDPRFWFTFGYFVPCSYEEF